jgi:hypothetical protein
MKKVLLCIGVACIVSVNWASAQVITEKGKDSVTSYYTGDTTVIVKNNLRSADPNRPVVLRWNIITASTHFDAGWNMINSGFCDNNTCYTHTSSDPVFTSSSTKPLTAPYNSNGFIGTSHNFYATLNTNNPADHSSAVVRINAFDTSSLSLYTFTFIGYKAPAGLISINSSDDIVMYPMPAGDVLNLVYDDKAGVSMLAIYNMIGKRVGPVYKPATTGSAKLELRDMPNGIYFIKLLNAQGQVIATRRFSHQ